MESSEHHEPEQISPDQPGSRVHLPALISDEFGISKSMAREQIALGTVQIDGEEYKGDRMDIPEADIKGKTIEVNGPARGFLVNYRG